MRRVAATLGLVALGFLVYTHGARAQAENFTFSFSTDLSDPSVVNGVPGTVTGEILGLTNNATSSAAEIIITSFPADLNSSVPAPVDVSAWIDQDGNSFVVSNGVITGALFHSDDFASGGFDQFFLNVPLDYIDGNTNYFDVGNGNNYSIWNNDSFGAITFSQLDVPEPASLAVLAAGLTAVGVVRRRRRAV